MCVTTSRAFRSSRVFLVNMYVKYGPRVPLHLVLSGSVVPFLRFTQCISRPVTARMSL
jgi:hypothetical protein